MSIDIPKQNTPVMDLESPALMSKPWWVALKNWAQAYNVLAALDFVFGGSTLTTIGAIPMVTAASTLGESSLTDNGVKVSGTEQVTIDQGATPATSQFQGKANALGCIEMLSYAADNCKVLFDGEWTSPDIIARDASVGVLIKNGAKLNVYGATGQAVGSAAVLSLLFSVDLATGDVDTAGVYMVAGTQVVGPRLTAVTAPTGGGTVVSAPVGGGVIDVQARAAIGSIITAISNAGNTVDPAARTAINDIRARLAAATGHGLTA